MDISRKIATFHPGTLGVLRIAAGLLFMQHGVQKLFGWLGGMGPEGGTAELLSLMGLAGVLETFGGLLLVLGLLTRPVAFILAAEMVVAYVMVHLPQSVWPILNDGELALLYLFIFAYITVAGPGRFALDQLRGVPAEPAAAAQLPAEERRRAA